MKRDLRWIGSRPNHACQRICFSMFLTPKQHKTLVRLSKKRKVPAAVIMRKHIDRISKT